MFSNLLACVSFLSKNHVHHFIYIKKNPFLIFRRLTKSSKNIISSPLIRLSELGLCQRTRPSSSTLFLRFWGFSLGSF
ncbi:unnamed protein product [Citrullus colocynthis]|uniref:Uncharacterized protein n=1 Tax=Citrullus colocynthis TaxID=252529 RepID=A0ABP0Z3S3_9ROSI